MGSGGGGAQERRMSVHRHSIVADLQDSIAPYADLQVPIRCLPTRYPVAPYARTVLHHTLSQYRASHSKGVASYAM
eukprot:1722240-Rhodomonas_salina.1